MQDYAVNQFPAPDHNHHLCSQQALARAAEICAEKKLRLTPQRRRVLEILIGSHVAMGAYDILAQLEKDRLAQLEKDRLAQLEKDRPAQLEKDRPGSATPRLAPIQVYRALDFLIAGGLAHRLAGMNAYTACAYHCHETSTAGRGSAERGPAGRGPAGRGPGRRGMVVLICTQCGRVAEQHEQNIKRELLVVARQARFMMEGFVVEAPGLCEYCSTGAGYE